MVQPQPTAPVRGAPPPGPITYEEFLEWANEDTWAEWVDHEVVFMSPAATRHQRIASFLTSIMRTLAEESELGEIISAPYQMKLENGREPDVLFVAEAHRDRLRDVYLDGPADLVVEIVSPSSGPRDRGDKFYEYEAGGVEEYWLVDPIREELEVYRLTDGHYRSVRPDEDGIFRSDAMPGFWLKEAWLWKDPLPKVLNVLRRWGLLE